MNREQVEETIDNVFDFGRAVYEESKKGVRLTLGAVYKNTVRFLVTRKRAYQLVFQSQSGEVVLEDLAKFCGAEVSTFYDDPRKQAWAEGKREVWLRIAKHLNRSPMELNKMFGGPDMTGEYV